MRLKPQGVIKYTKDLNIKRKVCLYCNLWQYILDNCTQINHTISWYICPTSLSLPPPLSILASWNKTSDFCGPNGGRSNSWLSRTNFASRSRPKCTSFIPCMQVHEFAGVSAHDFSHYFFCDFSKNFGIVYISQNVEGLLWKCTRILE
jgi:hypothetical protein